MAVMTTATVSTARPVSSTGDYSQELILAACVLIALLFFLLGVRWAKKRRHRHEGEHLVADIAAPESLADAERGGKGR
jgi:hypothetical protein